MGEVLREGSLVDEGEEEGSGWGFVGDMGLGEVGGEGEGTEAGATGEEEGVGRRERGKIQLW